MPRVYLEFTRKAPVTEKGAVAVEVDGTESLHQIYKKALSQNFKEFLINTRVYDEKQMEWEFEVIKDEDEDDQIA